ncbi:MAG TPA: rhodanese-like domain-containing protein [Flavobacterium sp.]|nr:rhodanese-like domain-containing protein [Flavobacterium sp.]
MVSKQAIRFIIISIIILAMFGIFKKLLGGSTNDQQLKEVIHQNAFLVDVRTPGEFASGSAKGAVNIPLDRLENQLGKFKGKENIVVFCKSGNRSGQAKRILEKNNFRNVINGGSWQNVQTLLNEK